MDKIKGAMSAVGDKLHHKDQAVHYEAKDAHKDAAQDHREAGKGKVSQGLQHAKEAISDKFNKNRAEAAEKIHSGPNAEAAATKEHYKAGEQEHMQAAKDHAHGAMDNARGAAEHTKEGAEHKKDAAKIGAEAHGTY